MTKLNRMAPGDIILIRLSGGERPGFLRHCCVTAPPDDSADNPRFVWPDEIEKQAIEYPVRIKVDFENVPFLPGLYAADWNDWLDLGWRNRHGEPYNKPSLINLFSVNEVPPQTQQDADSTEAFLKFLGCRRKSKPDRREEIGYAGEEAVYKHLLNEFHPPQFEVIWHARQNRWFEFDIEVKKDNKRLFIVEVKSTDRQDTRQVGLMSWKEKDLMESLSEDQHRLYFVRLREDLDYRKAEIRHLSRAEIQLVARTYQMKLTE